MDALLNDLRLDDITQRARAASPGPWETRPNDTLPGSILTYIRSKPTGEFVGKVVVSPADLAFICHAHDDIDFLLSLLSEYRHEAAN